jgi:hypothetical protein
MNPKPCPLDVEELRKACMKDQMQFMAQVLTPDRGYPVPVDNVLAFIRKNTVPLEVAQDMANLIEFLKANGMLKGTVRRGAKIQSISVWANEALAAFEREKEGV